MTTAFETPLDIREHPFPTAPRLKTVSEQIADHLAAAIVDGRYKAGDRLLEVRIAATFGASRAPVREAIRALSRRDLVRFQPRRGAFVVDLSLDAIADIFNMRAVLMGLAARLIARRPADGSTALMHERIAQVAAAIDHDDPIAFARLVGRVGAVVVELCRSAPLRAQLEDQAHHSVWGLLWRRRALDFFSRERRELALQDLRNLVDAIDAGDDVRAELLQRRVHFRSRESAIKTLVGLRGGNASPDRDLHDQLGMLIDAKGRPRDD